MQRIEGVNIQLGRLQNLLTAAAVETFDFSNYIDLKAMNIVPYKQAYHKFLGYTSAALTDMTSSSSSHSQQQLHREPERDFVVSQPYFILSLTRLFGGVFMIFPPTTT